MASSSRIEELQQKFRENPRRYFAPLANEYRKSGDVAQAIELCRAHLPQQPGHMSGHIVLGQALYEAQELDESRTIFEAALELDPENLIALRHLGDIARLKGEADVAARWYERVLDADPRNEEIASLLAEVAVARPAAAPRVEAPPLSFDDDPSDGSTGWGDINPDAKTAVMAPPVLPSAPTPLPPVTPPVAREAVPTPDRFSLDDLDFGDKTSADDRTADFAAESAMDGESAPAYDDEPRAAPAYADESFGIESGRSSGATSGGDDFERNERFAPPVSSEPSADFGFEAMEFVPPPRDSVSQSIAEPADYAGESGTPAAFVTETMAELYLQQGFRQEALGVYRQLLAQSPNDASLHERVRQLESGARSSIAAASIPDEVLETDALPAWGGHDDGADAFGEQSAVAGVSAVDGGKAVDLATTDDASSEHVASTDANGDGGAIGMTVRDFFASIADQRPMYGEAAGTAGGSGGAVSDDEEQSVEYGDAAVSEVDDLLEMAPASGSLDESPLSASDVSSDQWGGSAEDADEHRAPEGSLDALFGSAAVSPADQRAAATLSDVFAGDAMPADEASSTPAAASLPGRPTRSASTEISLDRVFRDTPSRATPGRRETGGFSFDQFFADEPSARTASPQQPAAAKPPADASGSDIEQFNDWLEGLKRK